MITEEIRRIENGERTFDDPRERKRTVPLEVLVLGMPRTGTLSLREALKQLGYKGVYHVNSLVRNPQDAGMWAEALRYKFRGEGQPFSRADWDCLLGEVQATTDAPAAIFMPELIAAYPDAKVIVCERDVDAWWRAMQQATDRAKPALADALLWLDDELMRPWAPMARYQGDVFGGDARDEAKATRAYRAYHAEVRGLVPEGPRRLEYRLGDGWEPLCRFLGKAVPEGVPFPQRRESRDVADTEAFIRARAWKRVRWTVVQFFLRFAVVAFVALGPLLILPKELFADLGKEA